MNETDIDIVVCPEGYDFVRPHKRGNSLIAGHCRKTDKQRKKELAREGISAIPFGWDVVVGYDYVKYGKKKVKGEKEDE